MFLRRLFKPSSLARSFEPLRRERGRHQFTNINFDKEGRYLVMHHHGAGWYYKMNFVFLALFLGATCYNYVMNSQVFFG